MGMRRESGGMIFIPRPHQLAARDAFLAARREGRPGFLMPAGGLAFCGRGPWVRDVDSDFLRREASPFTAVNRRSNSAALRICSDASRSDGNRGRGRAAGGASDGTGSSIAGPLKRSGEASPRLRARVTIGQGGPEKLTRLKNSSHSSTGGVAGALETLR